MYEDCLIETEEVKLALKRLPPEILNAREQRLKRAMVLSSQIKTVRLGWIGGTGRTGH